jgi:hypothetical protein
MKQDKMTNYFISSFQTTIGKQIYLPLVPDLGK